MCIIKKEIEESNLTCSGLEGKEECEKCPCREEVTEREAIKKSIEVFEKPSKHIKCVHKCQNGMEFLTYSQDLVLAFETAIDCLKEIQQYRAIGTVEECRRAMKNKMELPCAVGDTVYVIPSSENFGINIVNGHEENNRVYEQIVDHIELRRSGYLLSTCDGMACVIEGFYKETWFTDKKEAEIKLKELEKYWQKVFREKSLVVHVQ